MSEAINTLVVGASGHFAGLVVSALVSRGVAPLGFVRSSQKADKALRNGAGAVACGDLRDRASLEAALKGIKYAFYISPVFQQDEAAMGVSFVEAAKRTGVERIVFSSVIHPSLDLRNHASKRPIETALLTSDLEYTILQPAVLYQNVAAAWPSIMQTGVLAEPFSTTAMIARVDYRDVAEVAAIALTEGWLVNGSFELCGDSGKSREELAAIVGQVSKRSIHATESTFEEWDAKAKLPYNAEQKQQLAAMYAHYDKHGLKGNPFTLRAILGREPRSLHDFFGDLLTGTPTVAA